MVSGFCLLGASRESRLELFKQLCWAATTSGGRPFQSTMVLGRKAYLYALTSALGRVNRLWLLVFTVFSLLWWGTGWYDAGTSTRLLIILYNRVVLLFCLLSWSVSHPRSLIIAVTDGCGPEKRCGVFVTNLAALRWTISILSMYFCWCGSQILEQYSSFGRTVVM